jgi:hypothetical protein
MEHNNGIIWCEKYSEFYVQVHSKYILKMNMKENNLYLLKYMLHVVCVNYKF